MNAPPDAQLRLLDLQQLDSTLDRLAQRRRTLPELAEIDELDARLAVLRDDIVRAETEIADIGREERKIENDIDVVRTRMTRDQQRLDAGQVSNPKELESLQHELTSLKRRQADLEDVELERMEVREVVEMRLTELRKESEQLTGRRDSAAATRDGTWATIDAESATTTATRDSLAPQLPEDLLALYEKLRASSGGQGAAALHRGRCEGCHLTLSPIDLSRIKAAPEDEVLRCEECRRILVRRPDGGPE